MKVSYLTGFGNEHSSEAVVGALPLGCFSPQKPPLGLYAEKFSSTAFTAPRAKNRRSWFYRMLPSVVRSEMQRLANQYPNWRTAGIGSDEELAEYDPRAMRWDPIPPAQKQIDFLSSIRTVAIAGDTRTQIGTAVSLYQFSKNNERLYFVNADAEMLFIPHQGDLIIKTECGVLELAPLEIAVIPRGMVFSVNCKGGSVAAGYLCENYGAPLDLPERGPIGSDGFANDRDFLYPQAWYEEGIGDCKLIRKIAGLFFETALQDSPLDVVAWVGNSAPYKYNLQLFNTINTVSYDHPDPSIFTVLTSQSDTPGVANIDFVIFPPRWMVAENTFRPPWFHRNCMSEWMGLIHGVYDAKPDGFIPGGMSLHNTMTPHGPDVQAHTHGSESELKPVHLLGTMAFMVETRYTLFPTLFALDTSARQKEYHQCWQGFSKKFKKP